MKARARACSRASWFRKPHALALAPATRTRTATRARHFDTRTNTSQLYAGIAWQLYTGIYMSRGTA